MSKKRVVALLLTIMLASVLTLTLSIQPVKALAIVYIRADGSIDPPTAPIYTADNITYTFTSDITTTDSYYGIVIQRDNIVVDGSGHTLNGYATYGIWLQGRSNVTIQNTNVAHFFISIVLISSLNNNITGNTVGGYGAEGIELDSSNGNSISRNNVQGSFYGIWLWGSSANSIVENDMLQAGSTAIRVDGGSGNSVVRNRITTHSYGIEILSSSGNIIVGNTVTSSNAYGIHLVGYGSNHIYHNNFDNLRQAYEEINAVDFWDDGYPSGGNYWSDYTGVDEKSGPNQDQPGSDGIGDTPYMIDYQNFDHYPLMTRWLLRDVAVTGVVPSKTVVGLGYSLEANVTVANQGESEETFNVSLCANTTKVDTEEITLASGNSMTTTVAWNTTGFAYGNYTLYASAAQVPSETNIDNNNFTYGLVKVTIPGDVDGDFKVTMGDINALLDGFGSTLGPDGKYWSHPPCILCPHSPNCDIDSNRRIDMGDINYALDNFGKHYP